MSAQGSAAADDDSKKPSSLLSLSATALAALVLGLAGALLLVLTEVSTVLEIRAGAVVLETQTGADRHSWALLVLAIAAVGLTVAAVLLHSRPAALALGAVGVVALLFWLVGDVPDAGDEGAYGVRYVDAVAVSGPGLRLEVLGGVALLAAAAAALLALRERRRAPRARRDGRPARPARPSPPDQVI